MIAEIKPHTFINAIGAAPIVPPIPGNDRAFVVDSLMQFLTAKRRQKGNVVVTGGGHGRHGSCRVCSQKKVRKLQFLR